jgi:hypothetical protein
MLNLQRWEFFKMISDGDFFKEGPKEIDVNFGEDAQKLRALVAEFNSIQHDWFLKIDLEPTDLSKWWFRFKPLNREAFIFFRRKKIEKLKLLYNNTSYACRAAHTLYSFENEIVESVKDLETLARCTTAPVIVEGDPLTTNTNICKWCENVSPTFLGLSVPRKLSVLSILYGKYLGEDPLEFEEKNTIEDFMGGKNE